MEVTKMDAEALRALEDKAMKAAMDSGRIDDLEKATNIAKQSAEIQKATSDSSSQPKLLRYEEFKTWAALLVPFLSIATLAVTVYIQAAQLKATREANRDTQWRETEKNVLSQLSKPPSVIADPALAMTLLEPYTSDDRVGREATVLAVHLLSTVPSSDRFKDFFLSHHIGESWTDVTFLTGLSREVFGNMLELDTRIAEPSHPSILDAARGATIDDIEFLTERLCALYRANPTLTRGADFRDVFLLNGDLSGVDLTDADFTGAKLQNVNFANADLGGNVRFKNVAFVDSDWWDARRIGTPLLPFLIANQYPFFDNEHVTYDVAPPDRPHYAELVRKLCDKAELACKSDDVKYGDAPAQKQSQPK